MHRIPPHIRCSNRYYYRFITTVPIKVSAFARDTDQDVLPPHVYYQKYYCYQFQTNAEIKITAAFSKTRKWEAYALQRASILRPSKVSSRPIDGLAMSPFSFHAGDERVARDQRKLKQTWHRGDTRPYSQLLSQEIAEIIFLQNTTNLSESEMAEVAHTLIKARWKEQGIWNDQWTETASGASWMHFEPPETAIGEVTAKPDAETCPTENEAMPRRMDRHSLDASRPIHQFNYQVAHLTERQMADHTVLGYAPENDEDRTPYSQVKEDWQMWNIWNDKWETLPGMWWRHEEVLQEAGGDSNDQLRGASSVHSNDKWRYLELHPVHDEDLPNPEGGTYMGGYHGKVGHIEVHLPDDFLIVYDEDPRFFWDVNPRLPSGGRPKVKPSPENEDESVQPEQLRAVSAKRKATKHAMENSEHYGAKSGEGKRRRVTFNTS